MYIGHSELHTTRFYVIEQSSIAKSTSNIIDYSGDIGCSYCDFLSHDVGLVNLANAPMLKKDNCYLYMI